MTEKIACPKCEWEPDGGEYWGCSSCGHVWDTFKTAARCPSCGKQYHHIPNALVMQVAATNPRHILIGIDIWTIG